MSTAPLPRHPETGTVPLRGGVDLPRVGLGVFEIPAGDVQRVVEEALEVGYRHIDTAAAYTNEAGVGAAVRASGIPREDIVVTSKLRNGDQGPDAANAYRDTLARIGLDRLDLYLIHWPNPAAGLWQDSWRALAGLADAGEVGAVGVSNFLPEHLEELLALDVGVPAVDQIELHPGHQQRELVRTCAAHGIVVEAYSPLGRGGALTDPVVRAVAADHGATPAQVVLAWHLAHGHVVIPKTTSRPRLVENLDLGGLTLTPEEIGRIDALEAGARIGGDPRTFSISQIR